MRRLLLILMGCLFLVTAVIAQQPTLNLPPVDPALVSGDITIDGTASLRLLAQNIARRFSLDGYLDQILIEANGTTTAIRRFCNGEIDIVLADRQLTAQEQNTCTANGRSPIPFRIAAASVSVVVSEQNNFVTTVSTQELQSLFSDALTWNEVRPDFPAEPIARFGPSNMSPTFSNMALAVYGGETRPLETSVNAQFTDDLDTSISSIAASPYAVGFFESRFVNNEAQGVRAISINGSPPDFDTITSGTYPLARPLFLYTSASVMQEKPQVASFINYFLNNVTLETRLAGVYPPTQNDLTVAASTWRNVLGLESQPALQPTAISVAPVDLTPTPPIAAPVITTPTPTEDIPIVETVEETPAPVTYEADVQSILNGVITDLETLASEMLDGAGRPEGWQSNIDPANPQLPLLVRLNLEILAGIQYGDTLPANWFGAVNSTHFAVARDIRHDLELLADDVYLGVARPDAWVGDNPLYQCDRATQALVGALQQTGVFTLAVPANSPTFCQQAGREAALFTEINILAQPASSGDGTAGTEVTGDIEIDTQFGVAFYTSNASQRAGVVPSGEPVTPLARSNSLFSNMTLVQGSDFLLFVDYLDTTLTSEQFSALPTLEEYGEFEAVCNANWCEGQF